MAEGLIEVTEETFGEEIKTNAPVVLDFWAEWCGPCKRLMPIIEELAVQFKEKVKFIKIDVDTNQETAAQYQVMSIPTLVFIEQGEERDRMVGAAGKETLANKIAETFNI